ncbi:MAG: hypothetical protein J6L83_05240 [Clostridia bacterium]|nr:hypothetical protein [Clostridia bacterium]
MKKRLMYILFISALLCLSVFFVACGEAVSETPTSAPTDTETETVTETDSETVTETETETEEPETEDLSIPEDESVDYAAILAEWNKYINSVGKPAEHVYNSSTHVFTTMSTDEKSQVVSYDGQIASVVTTVHGKLYNNGEYEYYIPSYNYTDLYNVATGNKLLSLREREYNDQILAFEYTYEIEFLENAIIIVTEKNAAIEYSTRVEIVAGEEVTTTTVDDWNYVVTYSYYDLNGNKLAEDLESPAEYIENGEIKILTLNDKAYACNDGEILLVTDKDKTYTIPEFDVEYNGYRYSYENGKLQVINSEYKLVAEYTVPSHIEENMVANILSSGDVYFCSIVECIDEATDYDFIAYDTKYDVTHIVVSVTTGEAIEVDAPYIVSGAFMTNFTTDTTGIKLDGDYQYAEVRKFADGKLSSETEYVILDGSLAEVANLPKILKNQTALVSGMGDDLILIKVAGVMGSSANYVFDMADGAMTRYISSGVVRQNITGGFIYENTVYNDKLEVLYDLSDVVRWNIHGGAIMFTRGEYYTEDVYNAETDSYEETEKYKEIVYVAHITSDGDISVQKMGENAAVSYTGASLYVVKEASDGYASLHNVNGEEIEINYTHTLLDISVQVTNEDSVLVRTATQKVIFDDYGNSRTYTEYGYYIIK